MSSRVNGERRFLITAMLVIGMLLMQFMAMDWGPNSYASAAAPEDGFEYFQQNSGFFAVAVDFAPSGQAIVVGNSGGISKYDPAKGTFLELQAANLGMRLTDVDHSPAGEALIVGEQGTALTFDSSYFKHAKTVPVTSPLRSVAWRHDGVYATAIGNNGVMLNYSPTSPSLDTLDNTNVQNYDNLSMTNYNLISIDWAPDDTFALIAAYTGEVFRFTGDNLTYVSNAPGPITINALAISPDSSKALFVANSGQICQLDTSTWEWVGLTVPTSGFDLYSVAWKSPSTAYVLGLKSGSTGGFFKYTGAAMLEDITASYTGSQPYAIDLAFNDTSMPATTGMAAGTGFFRYPNVPPIATNVWVTDKQPNSISISYNKSNELDFWKYEYYISETKGFTPGPTTFTVNQTNENIVQYTFSGLVKITNYYIIVQVCDIAGWCTPSKELEATPLDITHPTPVTLSPGIVTIDTVGLSWTQFTDQYFAKYEIHKGTKAGFPIDPMLPAKTINYISTTSTNIDALLAGTKYYFKVRVYNTYDNYADSNEVSATTLTTPAPEAVTANNGGIDEATGRPILEWTVAKTTDFAKYEVHDSTISGFIVSNSTLFQEVTLKDNMGGMNRYMVIMDPSEKGKAFYFKVRVVDGHGGHSDSNEVTLVYSEKPLAVTGLSVSEITANSAKVSWKKPSPKPADFDHYEIYMTSMSPPSSKKVATIKNFDTTSYTVSGLSANMAYSFQIRMVNTQDVGGPMTGTTTITTKHDVVGDFFGSLNNTGCFCGVGVVGLAVLIGLISGLGQKYKGKGVYWAIPLIPALFIIGLISFINVVDDTAKITMWWAPWLFFSCAIASATIGLGTLIAMKASYSGRAAARAFAIAAAPTLIALLIIYIVVMLNNIPGQKHTSQSFFFPLLVLCIFASVGIAVGRVSLAKAKQRRWAEEEAKRAYDKRVEDYNAKRTATRDTLEKLENRIDGHRKEAPAALFNDVMRFLRDARKAFDQANNADNASYLETAKTQADNAERTIVDIEAYLVAKQQAKDTLAGLKARVDVLSAKRAPKIEVANGLYSEAVRKLNDAQTLGEVKVAVEAITKGSSACEESATGLKGAEEQLTDLKVQVGQLSTRMADLRNNPKEMIAASKVGSLISGVNAIIIAQTAKPDIDDLARAREQVRQAQSMVGEAEDRERQRHILESDIESLTADRDDTASWSSEGLDEMDAALEKARSTLGRDELTEARSALDEGFNQLEEVKNRSIPKLALVDREYEMQVGKWEDMIVELKNEGTASAQDIDFNVDSPSAQLQDIKDKAKSTYRILPENLARDTTKVPVKIQFTEEGAVPITFVVSYRDAMGRDYQDEMPLRVNVSPKMLIRPAEVPVKAPTGEDYGLKIKKDREISQGYYKFKVTIRNTGKYVARDVNFRLIFDQQTFRLHHIYPPELKLVGDWVYYGDIEPRSARPCEFYLEAHMCSETNLSGLVTFKDIENTVQTINMEAHKEMFVCPTFIDVEDITPAQVKAFLMDEGWKQDTRTYAIPSNLSLDHVFDVMMETIERNNPYLKHVFDNCRNDPFTKEAWYYGETKAEASGQGVKHIIIGKVTRVEKVGGTLHITGASMHQGQLFALSSRLGPAISDAIKKDANLARPIQQIFQTVEIRDSVLTGSTISMGGAAVAAGDGEATGKVSVKDSVMVRSEVAGGKDVDIHGSVMQRSKVGTPTAQEPFCAVDEPPPKPVDPMREFQYNVYRDTLRTVYEDGVVTMDEKNILKKLRSQLNISATEHETLEEEIIAEREARLAMEKKNI